MRSGDPLFFFVFKENKLIKKSSIDITSFDLKAQIKSLNENKISLINFFDNQFCEFRTAEINGEISSDSEGEQESFFEYYNKLKQKIKALTKIVEELHLQIKIAQSENCQETFFKSEEDIQSKVQHALNCFGEADIENRARVQKIKENFDISKAYFDELVNKRKYSFVK